ncbi:MAG TPA: lipopolysaccharide heptosyltransferase I [Thermoanaerobaculia bacterium]|nr:lipopolysaccharide heptosyltransferase I [Thermoanaerobaculia bacterium]
MTRLLVLRLSALGDVIHTIPAVTGLRDVDVSWVVEAPYAELVELVTGVDVIPVRLKTWGKSPLAHRSDMREALRRMRGADVSIDFQGLMKSAALGWVAGAKTRIGFDREAIREKPALVFTNQKVKVDTTKHVVEQNLQLVEQTLLSARADTSVCSTKPIWDAFPQPMDVRPAKIVLLPGAGKPNKLWPIERFRELAAHFGEDALVVWGPGEAERAQAIGARTAPPTNLRELAWLLQKAELVIGGDTGPLHLAAALGTKVAGLYGPTDPRRNGPYGQLDRVVNEFVTTKLMESITVESVMKLAERVLAE